MKNTSAKFQLIHRVFSLARQLNKKVYMSKSDWEKFYKAAKVDEDFNGAEHTKELLITDYRQALVEKAIYLDYNSVYGGYRIDHFTNLGGGCDFVFSAERMDAKKLVDVLSYAFIHQRNVEKGL